mmetsp:Transcript_84798/g.240527  ORF Transcript_84798/g.240527 Transcript_84798/m.240527 type:complete len:305 (+) Transcript_84798:642-1556(+)
MPLRRVTVLETWHDVLLQELGRPLGGAVAAQEEGERGRGDLAVPRLQAALLRPGQQDVEELFLGGLAHRLGHVEEDLGEGDAGRGPVPGVVLLRHARDELGDQLLGAGREPDESPKGDGGLLPHGLRGVGEALQVGGLQLGEERLQVGTSPDQQRLQRVDDRRLHRRRQAVAHRADEGPGDFDHVRLQRRLRRVVHEFADTLRSKFARFGRSIHQGVLVDGVQGLDAVVAAEARQQLPALHPLRRRVRDELEDRPAHLGQVRGELLLLALLHDGVQRAHAGRQRLRVLVCQSYRKDSRKSLWQE